MTVRPVLILAAVLLALAPIARADDADDLRREMGELRERLAEQERRLRELVGHAPTQDEIAAAVERYIGSIPDAVLVGGAVAQGKAGFPLGKRPFIAEGPNRLEIGFRNQVRYEAFLYGDDARANLTTTDRPKDRSGFELETCWRRPGTAGIRRSGAGVAFDPES